MKKTADAETALRIPAHLKKGDTIGLAAPAGPVREHDSFDKGLRLLEDMGFRVRYNRDLIVSSVGYLAASDQVRAADFNHLWADDEVKAILCVRGGYGSLRMIELLDMEQIRLWPKMLIGYSDITVLLNAINKETGLITFHGPVLSTLATSDKQSIDSFYQTLTGTYSPVIKPPGLNVLKPGRTTGILRGGNLATLVHLLGTPYEIPWDGSLLVIEDVGEVPYRIDRMFTQLKQAARLDGIRGLILGTFSVDPSSGKDAMEQEAVWNRILELVADKNIPVWADFPVGHTERNIMLPFGVEAEMDSVNGMLKLLGPCTS